MKWLRVLFAVLFLTSMMVVPIGCSEKTTELDASNYDDSTITEEEEMDDEEGEDGGGGEDMSGEMDG
jgi:hypothetical protein